METRCYEVRTEVSRSEDSHGHWTCIYELGEDYRVVSCRYQIFNFAHPVRNHFTDDSVDIRDFDNWMARPRRHQNAADRSRAERRKI